MHFEAYAGLGVMYKNGQGVRKDYRRALEYFKKAIDAGLVGVYNNIGMMYLKGQGMKQDYAKALKYFKIAARVGVAGAYNNLGLVYANGLGVGVDRQMAYVLLSKGMPNGCRYGLPKC
ncbi:tetratricopeptide repeat protein [Helicobacter bizzozeronii]|uniref:tetratricopeptide repeat protein n=1 Tax=Helicobacter bizzozeronii TaxID=56877 RepID=UPI0013159698|nr:tetratricopeptide repeat protein [Helicobacter bizzozeronii]